MSTPYVVPVTAGPQTFRISLANVSYQLTLQYRDTDQGGWFLDIADGEGNALINSLPLVTGLDLLAQYRYLGIAGSLVVLSGGNALNDPTYGNLGTGSQLYFIAQ